MKEKCLIGSATVVGLIPISTVWENDYIKTFSLLGKEGRKWKLIIRKKNTSYRYRDILYSISVLQFKAITNSYIYTVMVGNVLGAWDSTIYSGSPFTMYYPSRADQILPFI